MKKPTPKKQLLTEKQENFALEYVSNGGNASDAYRSAYNAESTKNSVIWVKAHEVLHSGKVSVRVAELRAIKYSRKVLSIEERKVLLSQWAEEGDSKAVDMLNKMDGVYVTKTEVEHKGEVSVKLGLSDFYNNNK